MKHWLLPEDHILEKIQDKNGTMYTLIFPWLVPFTAYVLYSKRPLKLPSLLRLKKKTPNERRLQHCISSKYTFRGIVPLSSGFHPGLHEQFSTCLD